jgi:hypothetical protein
MDHGNSDEERAMPIYEIEQFELYVQGHLVEADNEGDAIARFFRGEGKQELTSIEYAGISNHHGLSLTERTDLASDLMDRGVIDSGDKIIPSIRSIRQVK